MKHNLSKYTSEDMCDVKAKEKWKIFIRSSKAKNVYLGGVCALSHNLELNDYLNGQNLNNYVSIIFIVNALGNDKRNIAVVGNELLDTEVNITSLPANYYYSGNSQINYSVIIDFLVKWDNELSSKQKHVTLLLDIPNNIMQSVHLKYLRIMSCNELNYVTTILEEVVKCFKYHYRILQISRTLAYNGKDRPTFLDYIHMIANAWYNIPYAYVKSLCLPHHEGSLYFQVNDDSHNYCSISHWCKTFNIPVNVDQCPKLLDEYISCDNQLQSIYCSQLGNNLQANEVLKDKDSQSSSGVEAYQAMKRLILYLQEESAEVPIIKYAKFLENHIEYGALLQIHQDLPSTIDST